MAQYQVEYSCGHVLTRQYYGKESQRQWEIARDEQGDCRDCYLAKLPAKVPAFYICERDKSLEIFSLYSFEIKDELKARGYRFMPDFYLDPDRQETPLAFLDIVFGSHGNKALSGWHKAITSQAMMEEECRLITSKGYKIRDLRTVPIENVDQTADKTEAA